MKWWRWFQVGMAATAAVGALKQTLAEPTKAKTDEVVGAIEPAVSAVESACQVTVPRPVVAEAVEAALLVVQVHQLRQQKGLKVE